jgi:hypothetical protein
MILGIDPGKTGGWCLIDEQGNVEWAEVMPTIGGKVTAQAVAEQYREVRSRLNFGEAATVVIEKIFTKPSDAISTEQMRILVQIAHLLRSRGSEGEIVALIDALGEIPQPQAVRVDGRVGNLTYAKGAGMLHMPALWGWPCIEVSPATWCRFMHRGIDKGMKPKDRSRTYVAQHHPALAERGSPFWTSERAKKPHEGIVDAYMVAEWYRLNHVISAA